MALNAPLFLWHRLHSAGLCSLNKAERRKARRENLLCLAALLIWLGALCVCGGTW